MQQIKLNFRLLFSLPSVSPLNKKGSLMKKVLKKILFSTKLGNWIHQNYYQKYSMEYRRWKRCRPLKRHGKETLQRIEAALSDLNIFHFIDYGTLLGCIREHTFIKYDEDIDYGILATHKDLRRLTTCLLANGFEFKRSFLFEGRITEITFLYKHVQVDFLFTQKKTENFGHTAMQWMSSVPNITNAPLQQG